MTMRFNPPPGWPPVLAGWVAPPGWQPDPCWPEPPAGWPLWVEDRPALWEKALDSWLAMAGGAAVVLGSLLPLVSFNGIAPAEKPGWRYASVVFGLALVGLGFALRVAPPPPGRLVAGIVTVCLSSLAGLLYVGFIVVGVTGVPEQDQFGNTATLTFSPNAGIVLAVAGCAAAYTAAIRSFHYR